MFLAARRLQLAFLYRQRDPQIFCDRMTLRSTFSNTALTVPLYGSFDLLGQEFDEELSCVCVEEAQSDVVL